MLLTVRSMTEAGRAFALFTGMLDRFEREVRAFGSFPSLHMGLANDAGVWEHYDGHLKVVDAAGNIVADEVPPADYRDIIGEDWFGVRSAPCRENGGYRCRGATGQAFLTLASRSPDSMTR